jgi:2-C-methyl-D-erythritol 4-phosphate cytidylyltransferase
MALEDALSSVTVVNDKLDVRSKAITDEASALERKGFKPLMVEGSKDNIKVTNAADLELAAFYLQQQQAESDQEEVNR